jgi:hypothetical protein
VQDDRRALQERKQTIRNRCGQVFTRSWQLQSERQVSRMDELPHALIAFRDIDRLRCSDSGNGMQQVARRTGKNRTDAISRTFRQAGIRERRRCSKTQPLSKTPANVPVSAAASRLRLPRPSAGNSAVPLPRG